MTWRRRLRLLTTAYGSLLDLSGRGTLDAWRRELGRPEARSIEEALAQDRAAVAGDLRRVMDRVGAELRAAGITPPVRD